MGFNIRFEPRDTKCDLCKQDAEGDNPVAVLTDRGYTTGIHIIRIHVRCFELALNQYAKKAGGRSSGPTSLL